MDRKRIIFVDDDPNIIEGLRRMLRKQREEWDMVFVSNGTEALKRMAESTFDVIVSDLKMPGIDGAELLQRVLDDYPDVARIVLSGHADEATTSQALRVAHQYLSKPADPETLKVAVARACPMKQIARNKRIRAAVAACDKLPSMPTLCAEITRAVESEETDARQVATIISRDMAMSAKLLQLVNSSFFGIGRRVSSIEQTVALLGLVRIKALVLTDRIFNEFALPRPVAHFSMEQLWRHSLGVAEVARLVSREEGQDGDRPDQAFTGGLMHDVGMLVLASRHAEEFEEVLRTIGKDERSICQVEMDVLNVTHAEIGAYLLGLWGLPVRLVEAVALHHDPCEISYDGLCALSAVHVADVLVSETEQSESDNSGSFAPELDTGYIERIGLTHRIEQWRKLARNTCEKAMEPQT